MKNNYQGFLSSEEYNNLYVSKNADISYRDGDSEIIVREVLANLNRYNKIERFDYLENAITDWATKYHFSWDRQNILKPVCFQKNDLVLELGGGTGILTEWIADQAHKVISIEGTKMRASSIIERCKFYNNVDVLVANFLEIDLLNIFGQQSFDKITLIGVLEYTNVFRGTTNKDSINEILTICHKLLKPNGELIIAIENKIGLKYLLGFEEDHMGIPHYGTQNLYKKNEVVTFTRNQLMDRLFDAGYAQMDFWYPFPDYKLPYCIFREGNHLINRQVKLLLSALLLQYRSQNYSMMSNPVINEGRIIQNFIDDETLGVVSNSFLIVAQKTAHSKQDELFGFYFSTEKTYKFASEIQFSYLNNKIEAVEKWYEKEHSEQIDVAQLITKFILQESDLFFFDGISLQKCNEFLLKNDLSALSEEDFNCINDAFNLEPKKNNRKDYLVQVKETKTNKILLLWKKVANFLKAK